MVTEPAAIIDLLKKLESNREIQIVANTSVSAAWAKHFRVDGAFRIEIEANSPLEDIADILIGVGVGN